MTPFLFGELHDVGPSHFGGVRHIGSAGTTVRDKPNILSSAVGSAKSDIGFRPVGATVARLSVEQEGAGSAPARVAINRGIYSVIFPFRLMAGYLTLNQEIHVRVVEGEFLLLLYARRRCHMQNVKKRRAMSALEVRVIMRLFRAGDQDQLRKVLQYFKAKKHGERSLTG